MVRVAAVAAAAAVVVVAGEGDSNEKQNKDFLAVRYVDRGGNVIN
jgi:hypothetical protein